MNKFSHRVQRIGGLIIVLTMMSLVFYYYEPVKVFERWSHDYPRSAPLVFMICKMFTVLIPPLPSSALGLAGVYFFGWRAAFLYDFIANMGAALIAFFVARKFRPSLIRHFAFVGQINDWAEERLPGHVSFRSFLIIRIFTEGIFDFVSYAAGLTRIAFSEYFFATALGCLPMKFLLFYFGAAALRAGYVVTTALVLLILIGAVWLQKSRTYDRIINKVIRTEQDK